MHAHFQATRTAGRVGCRAPHPLKAGLQQAAYVLLILHLKHLCIRQHLVHLLLVLHENEKPEHSALR